MKEACYSAAILCFLYYVTILMYTKNKKANFAWFWCVFGMIQLGLGCMIEIVPDWFVTGLQIAFGAFFFLFLAVQVLIVSGMLNIPQKNLSAIIVLGACVRGKTITGALKRRLDRAVCYLNENPDTFVIVSGGKGKGEAISEASAMKEYLIACGIVEHRIQMEDQSTTTKENLALSKKYLKTEEAVGVVTNNFHLYRALKLAKIVGYTHVYGIAAGCDPILFLNYVVREFFAIGLLFIRQICKRTKEQIDK